MRKSSRAVLGFLLSGVLPLAAWAQPTRVITTAVPVLTLSPDSRSAALGEAGVAISPDASSIHWNAAKLGFVQHKYGVNLSYTPWLRNITDDMGLSFGSAYRKLTPSAAFSMSLLYFDLGQINFRDQSNNDIGTYSPKEYAVSAGYGQKLSPYFGVGIAARFIHSNLTGGVSSGGNATKPGNSAAVDLGAYYTRDVNFGPNTGNIAFGVNLSNVGAKISYTNPAEKDFLPTNLRLGTAITYDLDPFNKVTFTFDANKLLVPTPNDDPDDSIRFAANTAIRQKGLVNAMFTSFNDAPSGLKEEMQEVNLSTGLEYWYNDLIAARVGYFYENPKKGDRQYLSMGMGLRYQVFGVDAAYLIPNSKVNPLANTIRISLQFRFDGSSEEETPAGGGGTE